MESGVGFASHLHVAEVADCIRLRSRTDIASFDIADDNETLFLAVGNGLLIRCHSRNAELLIHGNLRFYSRNQIVCCVDNRFIELPNGLCSSFKCLSVLGKCLFSVRAPAHSSASGPDLRRSVHLVFLMFCNQFVNHLLTLPLLFFLIRNYSASYTILPPHTVAITFPLTFLPPNGVVFALGNKLLRIDHILCFPDR